MTTHQIMLLKELIKNFFDTQLSDQDKEEYAGDIDLIYRGFENIAQANPKEVTTYWIDFFEALMTMRIMLYETELVDTETYLFADALNAIHSFLWSLLKTSELQPELEEKRTIARNKYLRHSDAAYLINNQDLFNEKRIKFSAFDNENVLQLDVMKGYPIKKYPAALYTKTPLIEEWIHNLHEQWQTLALEQEDADESILTTESSSSQPESVVTSKNIHLSAQAERIAAFLNSQSNNAVQDEYVTNINRQLNDLGEQAQTASSWVKLLVDLMHYQIDIFKQDASSVFGEKLRAVHMHLLQIIQDPLICSVSKELDQSKTGAHESFYELVTQWTKAKAEISIIEAIEETRILAAALGSQQVLELSLGAITQAESRKRKLNFFFSKSNKKTKTETPIYCPALYTDSERVDQWVAELKQKAAPATASSMSSKHITFQLESSQQAGEINKGSPVFIQ